MERSTLAAFRVQQLQMVCTLAETGSVRATSEAMHRSAPAISKSLREVEHLFGVRLFERSPGGIATTRAGAVFAREARALLVQIERLHEAVVTDLNHASDSLRIGSAPSLAWCVIPAALQRIAENRGLPRIRMVEGRIVPLAEQLAQGELDAILTLCTSEAVEVLGQAGLLVDHLYQERTVVVSAAARLGRPRARVSWKILAEQPWILPPARFMQRNIIQQAFLDHGLRPPNPVIETTNIPATLHMVEVGLGYAAVPHSTILRETARRAICIVKTEGELTRVPVGFAYRRSANNIDLLYAFREAIRAHIQLN